MNVKKMHAENMRNVYSNTWNIYLVLAQKKKTDKCKFINTDVLTHVYLIENSVWAVIRWFA